ncbi:hypothetical protein ACIQM4_28765 [Streptomyces sp. NPDC091272]|uniref:hypothetical protein n=1 Tax=Streptomyces sp. NPDC091272 TaxID=3365981 RepID=UPI00381FBE12
MQHVFMGAFVLAVVVQCVTVLVLLLQLWRFLKRNGPEPRALSGSDVLSGAALFGGSMTVAQWLASTWAEASWSDTLLFTAVFAIATAGCMAWTRRAGHPRLQHVLLLLPIVFGALAGASGATF